jgi:hypothetical protein
MSDFHFFLGSLIPWIAAHLQRITMKRVIKLVVISLFLYSCRYTNETNENKLITFDLRELPETTSVKLSDLGFVDIEYIPLESNEQCVIPEIIEIIVGDDYYLTHFFTKVYMFQSDGSFVAKIGTEGRGPNEFTVVHDLDIDRKNHNIYLADGWQERFLVYSEKGDYIRTIRTPIYAAISFRFTDDGILCYNMNQFANVENSYDLIDTSGRIIKSYPNKYPWNKVLQGTALFEENLFYRFNNQLFKKEVYSDTVYMFENLNFKPHLVIEHGEKLLNTKARSEMEALPLFEKYVNQKNIFEFGDYIYYEFGYDFKLGGKNFNRGFIGSKKDEFQTLINAYNGFINDLDGGPNIRLRTIKDDNSIISWVDPLQLKTIVNSISFKKSTPKFPDKKQELEKLANSLKETDNPVLIIVRLKK